MVTFNTNICYRARDHLELLAIASNATQGDYACLNVVLVTLTSLYLIYSDMSRFDDSISDGRRLELSGISIYSLLS